MNNIDDVLREMDAIESENEEYGNYLKEKRNQRIEKEDNQSKLKIKLYKSLITKLMAGAGITFALATMPQACNFILDREEERLEAEYESMENEVEELTGRSIEEIMESGKSLH